MSDESDGRILYQATFIGSLLVLSYLGFRIIEPFMVQIGWAVVLAICLAPIQHRLRPRLGSTRTALLLTLLVLVLLVLPIAFALSAVFSQGSQAIAGLDAQLRAKGGAVVWLDDLWAWLRVRVPYLPSKEDLIAKLTAGVGSAASILASQAGGLLRSVALFVFDLLITLGVLFFLLRDAEAFSGALRVLLPFGHERNEHLLALTRDLVSASVTATLVVAIIQGIVGGLAFALMGIGAGLIWGFFIAILALVPVVGATIIWVPTAAWLMLSGSFLRGLILVITFVLLGQVDNVVRPLLLAGKARMNTLVLLVSLMGGVSAFGFIGIVLGPLVASLLTALLESYLVEPGHKAPQAVSSTPQPEPPPEPSKA